jgi:predicted TIM-barrel enzyme
MATLTTVTATGAADEKSLDVSVDVGKTLALLVLALAAIIGAVVLYVVDEDTGAQALLPIGTAILFGGFGIQVGENTGAREAESKLKNP